jgi:hypothetical protein
METLWIGLGIVIAMFLFAWWLAGKQTKSSKN